MASWADRLITVSQPDENIKEVISAWKENGGEYKPMAIKVQLSFDRSYNDALQGAYEQWKTNIFPGEIQAELRNPGQFEQAAHYVRPGDMEKMVHISHETGSHIDMIMKYAEMGFSHIDLHNVNRNQDYFLEAFGERVLPEVKKISVVPIIP
jgi:alkanesulfonate monooxygenase SsuD/methylene tetrahydromethanopterin reductase-like flavin-dependent oxidoreductase (luciferase family)